MIYASLIERKILFLLFACMLVFIGCGKDNDPNSLRSNDVGYYYAINNKQASERLARIMYDNNTDAAEPVERFKLVHISDAHLSDYSIDNHYKSPNNLLEAVSFANQPELKINAMAATGDHIGYESRIDALSCMEAFYANLYTNNRIPTFPCHGNHDNNMTTNRKDLYLTTSELSNAFSNKGNYTLQRKSGKSYYYADVKNPMGGYIRFIALDMLDQGANEINTVMNAIYSQEQISWLGNVALKEGMTENHQVIILTHYPFQPSYSGFLCDGAYVHSWKMIPEIVEAFRTKQPIQQIYKDQKGVFEPINVDFDFSDASGDFICYLGGHAHVTARFQITGLSNQSADLPLQHMLLCTNMSPSEAGTVFNKVPRTSKSLQNNSFCIYVIDTRQREIYITFFGAYLPSGMSTEDYPAIQSITY
ncbi:putative MPP superfamily phosphohydrolase [Parabacteroides sp. PF5-5]|uniref:metallophosphoesterase family protein n=1 Tax=unclassified Parabacteroides TaxID=2649774 RepID=UPI00247412B3|nr:MULTISPECIES: metallophosphoesterase [unclassified Parabacteroides]MDH6306218.1 putative MPP superfamily phosphohydrolase [Parabacteroides sp. PH5-39]MDH6317177.1 putative MPP superfamily phosphohydrolase [Parabacteroides sp. PF5-13]MDH6320930.1 putative MPP superfamily phosphohydrolase [Parabacteroides sp. PH5-13]MDH6324661.1 putative MPP superfamily phosphohydrolase [Parabacteroides sp. PH5-8]MDH6328288.1 putative MPP superfamily phosphohydrolase [Parabacteroides sp. PH5-41]